jgi:hypothetical protein
MLMEPKFCHVPTWLAVGALNVLVSRPASAQEIQGYVLELQGDELVIDLGSQRGAKPGNGVELWRPLRLKHPVTGRPVTDRFQIGQLRLLRLAIVRA